jgi:quercetin dioxygenase-like cupin family protein
MAKVTPVPDAVIADPKHYQIVDENAEVRIVRAHYGPREKSVMHTHPDLTVISLSEADVRFSFPDGTTEEVHMTPGQAIIMPATTHLPENLSNTPFEVLLVELKR